MYCKRTLSRKLKLSASGSVDIKNLFRLPRRILIKKFQEMFAKNMLTVVEMNS